VEKPNPSYTAYLPRIEHSLNQLHSHSGNTTVCVKIGHSDFAPRFSGSQPAVRSEGCYSLPPAPCISSTKGAKRIEKYILFPNAPSVFRLQQYPFKVFIPTSYHNKRAAGAVGRAWDSNNLVKELGRSWVRSRREKKIRQPHTNDPIPIPIPHTIRSIPGARIRTISHTIRYDPIRRPAYAYTIDRSVNTSGEVFLRTIRRRFFFCFFD